MSNKPVVFDTCAVIKLLNQEYDLSALGINIDETRLLTSVIVRMELLSKRLLSRDEERGITEFLDALTVVPLNEVIERQAIEIRRAVSLKLPDCIVAATSIVLDAVLITDDEHLLGLSWPGFWVQGIS